MHALSDDLTEAATPDQPSEEISPGRAQRSAVSRTAASIGKPRAAAVKAGIVDAAEALVEEVCKRRECNLDATEHRRLTADIYRTVRSALKAKAADRIARRDLRY